MPAVYYLQPDQMDCGPTCLRMVAKYYGRTFRMETLRKLCEISKEGVSLLGISEAAEKIGFHSIGVKLDIDKLKTAELPCILHWRENHFVVLYKIKSNNFYIGDPAAGKVTLNRTEFKSNWQGTSPDKGIALLLSPSPAFHENEDEKGVGINWTYLTSYLVKYRKLLIQLIFGLGIASLLQILTPFLTQSIVDVGINNRNLNFIYVILIAQIGLTVGRVSVEFMRSWILLHITTRVNISILTDFLMKLMRLPMSFFDTKMTGDILQRIEDQRVIQTFLTGSTLSTIFSMFNLLVFLIVLAYYNSTIFFVFAASSILYISWIFLFLSKRRRLNYNSFNTSAKNQENIVQLIGGMQEIKLNNCEQQKRWEWENTQARLFKFNVKTLALSQYQQGGATLINEGKNIFITFLSAQAVIQGNMTLGAMLAVQYIVGQLSAPIDQMLGFIQSFQDAKISLERLNEIHEIPDEEKKGRELINELPIDKSININNLTFRYPGAGSDPALENVDLRIPEGKTTAIVGMSGSGKTTILKLLLRFYEPQKGEIKIGDQSLGNFGFKMWRSQCGVVMQDGFIFSDTIEKNIAVGDDSPDRNKLNNAIRIANIQDFIDTLPLGLNTAIGAEGNGISQGQRQRILIARAVYKNPQYILFDEATNALDAINEQVIVNNLQEFFKGRTVIIVAHRLSTVSNADNIVLLEKGIIVEQGSHKELILLRGNYFNLVRNQLELGI